MPMFYTPKPRQFHYKPRFYDPEKERWEALKQKYAEERTLKELLEQSRNATSNDSSDSSPNPSGATDLDLEYFERRVREINSREKQKANKLTWRDLFRKRKMPEFKYTPRFSTTEAKENVATSTSENEAVAASGMERMADFKRRTLKIKRRYDINDDEYMKPVSGTRIILYCALVVALLYWILS